MKKVLSLVLVIAMVLSSMSFAFAGTFTDVAADNNYEDAINALVGLGIVKGYEDGTFKPEKVVTRAEMAKMMVITLGYGDLVAGSKSNFADTQGHWADAYIALAAGKGIVVGTGNGKFDPDRTVSYNEAITMLVRGLGYTDSCNELKGMTWPTNFKVKAAELGITKDVKLTNNGADRGGVAQLIDNSLKATLVTVNTDGDVIKTTTTTTDSKGSVVTKFVPLLSRLATAKTIAKVTPDHLDKDKKAYLGNIVDMAPYMYQEVEVYVNDDDDVVYVNDVKSDVLVGEFRTATDDAGKVNVRIDGKNKLYTLDSTTATSVFYNGVEVTMSEADMEVGSADITDLHKAKATFVLNSETKKITGIIAEKYTAAKQITNVYNGKTKLEGYMLPLNDDDKPDYDDLTVRGAVTKLEDIKEDDVVVLFTGKGAKNATTKEPEKLIIEVVRDVVEGKITETNKDGEVSINGKFYPVSVFAPKDKDGKQTLVVAGDEGKFFLDTKGAILAYEAGTSSKPVDYAVITKALSGVYSDTAKRVIVNPEIKLVNAKGEVITYKIKDTATITNDGSKVLTDTNSVTLNEKIKNFQVIKYSINSSNEITKITLVAEDVKTGIETDSKAFVLASNALVFNKESDGDVVLVDKAKLGDKVDQLARVSNKNGEIEMLFVNGLGSSDTYAFLAEIGTGLNSDDVEVQKLVAYVNGVKKTYYSDKIDTVTKSAVDTFKVFKLGLDGDVIEGLGTKTGTTYSNTAEIPVINNNTVVDRVNGNRFQIGDKWYTLADDAGVYVLDANEFDSVGSASSLYAGAKIAGYAFDADNIKDNVIEILFIFE